MPLIRVAAAAEEDLKEIWAYVAENNPGAANSLLKEIIRRFAILRDYPHIGRKQDKLLANLRGFAIKDYVIFYRPFEGGIEILRVLHGSRDIESIFEDFLKSLRS